MVPNSAERFDRVFAENTPLQLLRMTALAAEQANVVIRDGNVTAGNALPLVVQLGFAGSRKLLEGKSSAPINARRFHAEIENWLTERIKHLRVELGLEPRHFLCGISQVAIGADTIFSNVCRSLGIPQRVFLPQPCDEYVRTAGSDGTPDFSPEQQNEARAILESSRVIQQHVASESADRNTRFEEANLEIAQASDLVVCLVRANAQAKTGGTNDLVERAAALGRPVLEIRVSRDGDGPRFDESWHGRERFRLPVLPHSLTDLRLPHDSGADGTSAAECCNALKEFGSRQAAKRQTWFKRAAPGDHRHACFGDSLGCDGAGGPSSGRDALDCRASARSNRLARRT